MARSRYIYVAVKDIEHDPSAHFTVKHEAVAWVKKHSREHGHTYDLYRYPEAGHVCNAGVDPGWCVEVHVPGAGE